VTPPAARAVDRAADPAWLGAAAELYHVYFDYGDDAFEWRIRPMGRHTHQIEDDHGRPS
jgi:hypothetical protein